VIVQSSKSGNAIGHRGWAAYETLKSLITMSDVVNNQITQLYDPLGLSEPEIGWELEAGYA